MESCKDLPLAVRVIATSLSDRPYELWQKIVLEDNPINKDLALFPENQRNHAAAFIDMWAELYKLDNNGIEAMSIINKIECLNS